MKDINETTHAVLNPDFAQHDTFRRPRVVAIWARRHLNTLPESQRADAGRAFWRVIQKEWAYFDLFKHEPFERLFRDWRDCWTECTDRIWTSLPRGVEFTIFRGASPARESGLAWTLDPEIAERFACALRNGKDGIVQVGKVGIGKIAFTSSERSEREVVLFERLAEFQRFPVASSAWKGTLENLRRMAVSPSSLHRRSEVSDWRA